MVAADDVERMRTQLFFEGPDVGRRVSRFWLLLILAAIIVSAGVAGDSTATVIGAMIVAPLMTPILGIVLSMVLNDRRNLLRSIAMVVAGGLLVVAIGYLLGLAIVQPVTAATNSQVAARVSPRACLAIPRSAARRPGTRAASLSSGAGHQVQQPSSALHLAHLCAARDEQELRDRP